MFDQFTDRTFDLFLPKKVMSLNIGNDDDPFYRYKMPSVEITHLTNFTHVKNINAIAKSLNRSVEFILKFISLKLSIQVNLKKQYLNGTISKNAIQDLINKFVTMYVICDVCGNPETIIIDDYLECKACGGKTEVNTSDKVWKYSKNF